MEKDSQIRHLGQWGEKKQNTKLWLAVTQLRVFKGDGANTATACVQKRTSLCLDANNTPPHLCGPAHAH